MIRMKGLSEFSHLNELRTNQKFCDVTIKIGHRSFPCHRVILFATMKYFRSMFGGEFVEAEKQEIELKSVNADEFEQLLTFVYGGTISADEKNVLRLFKIAHYFGLQSLENSCVEYIVENSSLFSSDSILSIFELACVLRCTTLVDALKKSVAENFVRFSNSKKLYHVSGSDLLQIFAHPNFECDTTAILDFLSTWIQFRSDEERNLLPEILDKIEIEGSSRDWILKTLMNVTFKSIAEDELDNTSLVSSLVMEIDECERANQRPFKLFTLGQSSKYKVDSYKFQAANDIQFLRTLTTSVYNGFQCKTLFMDNRPIQFTLVSHQGQFNSCYVQNKMELYITKPSGDSGVINTFMGKKFEEEKLICGNENENIFTAAVHKTNIYYYNNVDFVMYSCDSNSWSCVEGYGKFFAPNMLSIGDCLYMIGGLNFNESCPILSRLGSNSRETPVSNFKPCSTDGKLFKRYDVLENKWTSLENMKYPRCKAASCVYNDIIYVSGGDYITYYKNYNVEYYDLKAGVWGELETPMPKPKVGHCLLASDDRLWFFGGEIPETGKPDLTYFSYNLKDNTWSEICSLPSSFERVLDVHVMVEN